MAVACEALLRRYGVVFRAVLERESLMPPWRQLLRYFRRMEDRGEVHGGRFVDGFSGEQFALPEAVGLLKRQAARDAWGSELARQVKSATAAHRSMACTDCHAEWAPPCYGCHAAANGTGAPTSP